MNTRVSPLGLKRYAEALARASQHGDKEAVRLILKLTDTEPCPKCNFIKHSCRCVPTPDSQYIGVSTREQILQALEERHDLSGPPHERIKALVKEIEVLKAEVQELRPKSTPSSLWSANNEPDPHAGHYDAGRARLPMGNLTDDQLANAAFLNFGQRPSFEDLRAGRAFTPLAWMTAMKDRIRWLSRSLERALVGEAPEEDLVALTADGYWTPAANLKVRPDAHRFTITAVIVRHLKKK